MRSVNGDAEALNYLIRGREVEQRLSEAMHNDAKLSIANTKINVLEKNLSTRSKETSMQNVRLQELEQLLSQTSIQPKVNNTPIKVNVPSEEVSGVKEENRVLNEAVEVLQIQVDEYKREIRSMKEPTKHRANGSTPRKKSMTSQKKCFIW